MRHNIYFLFFRNDISGKSIREAVDSIGGISYGHALKMLKQLEQEDFIERRKSVEDARLSILQYTHWGRALRNVLLKLDGGEAKK